MREVSPDHADHLVKSKPFVVIKWCRPDLTACADEEKILDSVKFPFDVVKVDVTKNRRSVKKVMQKYGVEEIYPAVSIFRGGYVQKFRDSKLFGQEKEVGAVYGYRNNILDFIERSVQAYRKNPFA